MSPNNEHAAILRGMAQAEQSELAEWLESINRLEAMPLSKARSPFLRQYKQYAAEATCKVAAFTAGAEALEAVEAAKAALQAEAAKIANGTPTMDGKHFYRILSGDQHAVATAYKTAQAAAVAWVDEQEGK